MRSTVERRPRTPAVADAPSRNGRRASPRRERPPTNQLPPPTIRAAQLGDGGAFQLVYRAYHEQVYRYLRAVLKNVDDAQEVMQHVFLRALERIDTFRIDGEPFEGWLMTIARNAAIDHRRRSRRLDIETPEAIALRQDGDRFRDYVNDESLSAEIRSELARLPQPQRDVVVLRSIFGMTAGEVGQSLGHSADSVRHFHQRGLKALRAGLSVSSSSRAC